MNKKVLKVFFGVCGMITLTTHSFAFSHVWEKSLESILRIHNYAMNVNNQPIQHGSNNVITSDKIPVAIKYNQKNEGEESIVFSFINLSKENFNRIEQNAQEVAEHIYSMIKDSKKEVMFTGYGYGANFAADVLDCYPLVAEGNRVKFIAFCAQKSFWFYYPLREVIHFTHYLKKPMERGRCTMVGFPLSYYLESKYDVSKLLKAFLLLGTGCLVTNINTFWTCCISILGSLFWSVSGKPPTYLTSEEVLRLYGSVPRRNETGIIYEEDL